MHPVIDQRELGHILELARKYLEPHQPADYRLDVCAAGVQREDDWYYVVVEPSRNDIRSHDYSSRLAEAELDLQENEDLRILFVPALPD